MWVGKVKMKQWSSSLTGFAPGRLVQPRCCCSSLTLSHGQTGSCWDGRPVGSGASPTLLTPGPDTCLAPWWRAPASPHKIVGLHELIRLKSFTQWLAHGKSYMKINWHCWPQICRLGFWELVMLCTHVAYKIEHGHAEFVFIVAKFNSIKSIFRYLIQVAT